MSTTISYKGATIATIDNTTKTLNTSGTWMEDDLTITDTGGGGTPVLVIRDVPNETGTTAEIIAEPAPSGSISITTNGTHNVYDYAEAVVNVPSQAPSLQSKSVSYTPSTTTQSATVSPDGGYDGLSQVSVTVDPVPEGEFDIDIANAGFYDDAGVRKWHARASFDAWDGWIPPDSYYGPYRERNAVPAGTVITPSSTAQTVGGANWVMEGPVTIEAAGGGSSSWSKLGEATYSVSTSETTSASVGTVQCGSSASTKDKIIYVRIRDTAGPRPGYFLGSDSFFINHNKANGSSSTLSMGARVILRYTTSETYGETTTSSSTGYGVYAQSVSNGGGVAIYRRYHATNSLTINGDYKVEVYALDYPDGVDPFTI